MLILITNEKIRNDHIQVLQQSLRFVDKLHLRITEYSGVYTNYIENILSKILVDSYNELKNKIVIHLNKHTLSNNNESVISVHKFQKIIDELTTNFSIHNFHFSEEVSKIYLSLIQNHEEFYHHYHSLNVSASIHHFEIEEDFNHFNYLIYGPVFESISKKNYFPKVSHFEIQNHLHNIHENFGIPIIAIGGINSDNFKEALKMGFSGVAIKGHIWQSTNPLEQLLNFYESWKKSFVQ
ncbi:MAG: hypothetical protein KatS3mg027_1532 [Bacteroidia bacterium]|nr:MAG: hypothetical protein KatS3mg027_1532 [Bacteroidia bacterium]